MNDSHVKVEVHLIQNFAPSNLNRDDTGQPKDATFGGFRRARISSQCSKRSIRQLWRERGSIPVGERTKRLQGLILDILLQSPPQLTEGQDNDFLEEGIRVFTDAYYAKPDKKEPTHTSVLTFISPEEVQVCAEIVRDLWPNKTEQVKKKGKKVSETTKGIASIVEERRKHAQKSVKKKADDPDSSEEEEEGDSEDEAGGKKKDKRPGLKREDEITARIKATQVSADIALFGRMLAEQPGRNTDGSCQVAHPISTHKVDMEMDFFTAVDDLNPAEETGAGMMGVVGFNSACFYRYALVDRDTLARNLARKTDRKDGKWTQELNTADYEEADKVIQAFLEAMVYAIPTGKQNSFAAQNLPSFGLFVARQGGVPISLANAFAKPIRTKPEDDDLVGLSVARLTEHWETLGKVYGSQGVKATSCFHVAQDDRLNALKDTDKGTVQAAITAVMKAIGAAE